jgi:hypothetical protein
MCIVPLQNPTLGVLVTEGKQDGKQSSGLQKPRCEASYRRLHGSEVVIAVS